MKFRVMILVLDIRYLDSYVKGAVECENEEEGELDLYTCFGGVRFVVLLAWCETGCFGLESLTSRLRMFWFPE